MVSAYQRALDACGDVELFTGALLLHLHHGYVYSSPTAFAMARPVALSWTPEELSTVAKTDPDGDAWFVWAVAGDMREALSKLPFPKKWLAFCRRGSPRIHRLELARLIDHEDTQQLSGSKRATRGAKSISATVQHANEDHESSAEGGGGNENAEHCPR